MKDCLEVFNDGFSIEDYNRWFDEAKDEFEDRIKNSGPEERLELIDKIDKLIAQLEEANQQIGFRRDYLTDGQPGNFLKIVITFAFVLLASTSSMIILTLQRYDAGKSFLVSFVIVPFVILGTVITFCDNHSSWMDYPWDASDIFDEITNTAEYTRGFLRYRIVKKTQQYQDITRARQTTVEFIKKLRRVKRKLLLAK